MQDSALKKVYLLYMSPTGGVKKVARALERGFAAAGIQCGSLPCLTPAQRAMVPKFDPSALVVMCFPVFGGRVPACLTNWPELSGGGALAVSAAVYGNRACEDAPREMAALLKAHGFKVIASAELIAEHSLERRLAAGRPDADDAVFLQEMAAQILKAAAADTLPALTFARKGPYKPYGSFVQPQIINEALCGTCRLCAKLCPQSLLTSKPQRGSACLGCMACLERCPKHNLALPEAAAAALHKKMEQVYELNRARRDNQLTIGLL